jgi:hypothetical protein
MDRCAQPGVIENDAHDTNTNAYHKFLNDMVPRIFEPDDYYTTSRWVWVPLWEGVPSLPAEMAKACEFHGDTHPHLAVLVTPPTLDAAGTWGGEDRLPRVALNPLLVARLRPTKQSENSPKQCAIRAALFTGASQSAAQDEWRMDAATMLELSLRYRATQFRKILHLDAPVMAAGALDALIVQRAWQGFLLNPSWLFNLSKEKAGQLSLDAMDPLPWVVRLLKQKDTRRPMKMARTADAPKRTNTREEILGLDYTAQTRLNIQPTMYRRFPRDAVFVQQVTGSAWRVPAKAPYMATPAASQQALVSALWRWCGTTVAVIKTTDADSKRSNTIMNVANYWFSVDIWNVL